MNDTENNLKPATPGTAVDSAGSLERMVRPIIDHMENELALIRLSCSVGHSSAPTLGASERILGCIRLLSANLSL